MATVQWDKVPQQTYDDMVAVLISTLHPAAERLDGSGGDGDRDIQIRHDDGRLDLFELKSFTGRLGWKPNRRSQVERSLKKAAQHNPNSWTLVVPIDHNKEELAWFDRLRRRYPFPLVWSGRTWLDKQMASHPAIVRYYLEDGDSEALRLLLELNREQARLAGGFPDALERLRVLKQRIDEVSPHWRLDVSLVGDTITMQLRPCYRGAERDHPILITTVFDFPDTPTGQEAARRLRQALDYGDEVVVEPDYVRDLRVDLPGRPGEVIPASPRIIMGPAGEGIPFRLDARAVISDPAGTPLGSLPLWFDRRQPGPRGGELSGQDATGVLRLSMRIDHLERKGTINFQIGPPPDDLLPGALLPTLRLLQHLHAPNRLEVRIGASTFMHPSPLPPTESISPAYIALLEDLERVQGSTHTVFPVPRELRYDDISAIRRAARLVAGEQVPVGSGPASASITLTDPQVFEKLLVDDTPFAVAFTDGNYSETIAGVEVPLGPAIATLPSATVADRAELLAARPWHADQQLAVRFQPSPGVQLEILLASSGTPGRGTRSR
jgi:hypothetical protein